MSLPASDVVEIEQLIYRLCQALDFSRPTDFVDVFVPTGVFEAQSSNATGNEVRFSHQGSAELRAFAENTIEKRHGLTRHVTVNPVVTESEAGADAVSGVLFMQIVKETGERTITISGTHHDSFVRTDDGWRFTKRTIVADLG